MVIKIMASSPTMKSALEYNDKKVSQGDAEVIQTANIDADLNTFHDTIKRYEKRNFSSKELSFHMSVNPSSTERMSEEKVKELVSDIMEGLGYAKQPYAIYRHDDIGRVHYHVVSIRTDSNGRKIPSRQENRRCLLLQETLSMKYGFIVGCTTNEQLDRVQTYMARFTPAKADTAVQIDAIIRYCCTYRFSSYNQFSFLLNTYGVSVTEVSKLPLRMVFRGLDAKGKVCTVPISRKDLSFDPAKMFEARIRECNKTKAYHGTGELSQLCSECLMESLSQKHFRAMMAAENVDVKIARNSDGVISKVMFVDHETKSVHNLSDLKDVSLADFRNAESMGQWAQRYNDTMQEPLVGMATLGDLLSSLGGGRSQSKDIYSKSRKKSKGVKM
jgi:uncharacterized FlaG/YvyC family protein